MAERTQSTWYAWPGGGHTAARATPPDAEFLLEEAAWFALTMVVDAVEVELPGRGVRHPLAVLSALAGPLQAICDAGEVADRPHLLMATRRMSWRLRTAGAIGSGRRRELVGVATNVVTDWLEACFGSGEPMSRGKGALQMTFALLGLLERRLAYERYQVALALAVHTGSLSAAEGSQRSAEALLQTLSEGSSEILKEARIDAAATRLGEVAPLILRTRLRLNGLDAVSSVDVQAAIAEGSPEGRGGLAIEYAAMLERTGQRNEALDVLTEVAQDPRTSIDTVNALVQLGGSDNRVAHGLRVRWGLDASEAADMDRLRARIARLEALERSTAALQSGDARSALGALRRQESDVDVLERRAEAYTILQKFDRALEHYRQAAALDPERASVRAGIGRSAAAMQDWETATTCLAEAMQLGWEEPEDAVSLAMAHLANDEFVQAEQWLEHAESWGGDVATGWASLAAAALKRATGLVGARDLTQAEGMVSLIERHGDRQHRHQAALIQWCGAHARGDLLETLRRMGSDDAGAVVLYMATRERASWWPPLDAITEVMQGLWPDVIWTYVMLSTGLSAAGDIDGALMASEAGLLRFPHDAVPALVEARTQLWRAQCSAHQERGDVYAAAAALGQGLIDCGLVSELLDVLKMVLASNESERLATWEEVLRQILGTEGLATVISAMRAEVRAAEVRTGPLQSILSQSELSVEVPPPIEDAVTSALEQRDGQWITRLSSAIGGVFDPMPATGGPALVEGTANRRRDAPVPGQWTTRRIGRASDAFDDDRD